MQQTWEQEFDLRHYELDHAGKLALPYLCRMLQETAARHADNLNIAHNRLSSEGLTWILSRFHVRIVDPGCWPGWKDKIFIQTWRATLERLFAVRDYRMSSSEGKVIAVATSSWGMLDVQRRRLVQIPEFVTATHPVDGERALPSKFEKLPAPERVDHQKTFVAGLHDIDLNDHVNNVAYIRWALDTVPRETWSKKNPVELEILFRAEALYGDELRATAEERTDGDSKIFLHQLTRTKDNKKTAQVRTVWR